MRWTVLGGGSCFAAVAVGGTETSLGEGPELRPEILLAPPSWRHLGGWREIPAQAYPDWLPVAGAGLRQ